MGWNGMAIFPELSAEQREQGFTDFNDLAREDAHLAKRQLEEAVWSVRQQVEQQTVEIGMPRLNSRAGREAGVGLATGWTRIGEKLETVETENIKLSRRETV